MTLSELRQEAWDWARETATNDIDRLWSKKEMNRYINRVYRMIARETKCIRDAITPTICQITSTPIDWTTLVPADGLDYTWATTEGAWLYQKDVCPYIYTLNPLIIDIDEIKWTNRQWKLTKVSCTKWQTNPWWEQVLGMPTEYATDLSNGSLALNFRSEVADTLRLQVRRMPLVDLINDTDTPEFRTHYHDFMLNGILSLMYAKQDSQTFDAVKTLDYATKYKVDIDEIKQQESILDQRLKPNNSQDAFR